MNSYQLFSEILKGHWLIDQQYAFNMLPMVAKLVREGSLSVTEMAEQGAAPKMDAKHLPAAAAMIGGKMASFTSYDNAPERSTAIIALRGTVMKNDFCGAPGTRTIDGWVKQADAHPNISSILLVMDSPGGSVAGTFSLAQTISSTQKPLITFVEDLAASAGYAIASGAKEIWAASKTTQIGSIGTMIALTDSRAIDEQFWGKEININATLSPDKNNAYYQALDGNTKPIIQEVLDPLNAVFHDTVKNNRAGKLKTDKNNEPLTGKTYVAETAMNDFGLIDAIGTIEQAITRVQELAAAATAQDNQPTTTQTTTDTIMSKKSKIAWASIGGFLGLTFAAGAAESNEELTDAHLEKLNAEMTRLQGVEAAATETATALATAKADLATQTQLVADLTATVAKLGAQPGAKPTNSKKETSDAGADGGESKSDGIVDPEADHNKGAMELLGKA